MVLNFRLKKFREIKILKFFLKNREIKILPNMLEVVPEEGLCPKIPEEGVAADAGFLFKLPKMLPGALLPKVDPPPP